MLVLEFLHLEESVEACGRIIFVSSKSSKKHSRAVSARIPTLRAFEAFWKLCATTVAREHPIPLPVVLLLRFDLDQQTCLWAVDNEHFRFR